jgi:hypothetical protein
MDGHRQVIAWFLIVVTGIPFLGYASAMSSRQRCEEAIAKRISDGLRGREIFVLSADPFRESDAGADNVAEDRLRRAGFRVRQCASKGNDFDCFPWAGIDRGRVIGPFLVAVRWSHVSVPLGGGGTTTRFLTLFGLVVALGDFGGWVT